MTVDKLGQQQLKANIGTDKIKPKGVNILLRYPVVEEKKTQAGIILPDLNPVKEKPAFAYVEAISDQCLKEVGEDKLPKVGDKVMYQKGTQYDLFLNGGQEASHCFVAWYDILCIVED